MTRQLALGFILFAFPLFVAQSIDVHTPPTVERGLPLQLVIHPAQASGTVRASIEDATGRSIARAVGFSVTSGRDLESTAVLLGVPSTVEPGRYRIRIEYFEATTSLPRVQYRELQVLDRDYFDSAISLSMAMSELRTTTDPRRYRETRELMDLLGRFMPDAIFALGEMVLPVVGEDVRVSARFGDRRQFHYADGGRAGSIHNGLDLAAPTGTPVVASASGRVVFAGDRLITGYSVVLEHLPGVYGLYYHLDSLATVAGEFVRRGEELGAVGATGLVTGPHLHWEIRVSGVAVEPEWFLAKPLLDTQQLFSIINNE